MTVKELKERLDELIEKGGEKFTVLVPVEAEWGETEANHVKVNITAPGTVTIW